MVGVDLRTWFCNDHGHAHLAKVWVGHTHQSTFGHTGHLVDVAFNFCRVDVVAATDDQVFAAAHNDHITTLVNFAHITCFEKTISSELFLCFFGHAPIGLKNIGAFDLNTANFAHRQGFAIITLHTQFHPWQRKPNGATTTFTLPAMSLVGRIRVGSEHDGFTHAVAFQNSVSGALLPFCECFNQQGG